MAKLFLLAALASGASLDYQSQLTNLLSPILDTGAAEHSSDDPRSAGPASTATNSAAHSAGGGAAPPQFSPPPMHGAGPKTGSWLGGPADGGDNGEWLKDATQETPGEEADLMAAYQQQLMQLMQQQYTAELEAQEAHAAAGGGPWMGSPFLHGDDQQLNPAAPMPGVLELDQYTAAKLIGGRTPIILQFYLHAMMCPNCAVMAPAMRALGSQYATEPNLMVAKVDAMAEAALSTQYGVDKMSLPAVLHFPAGSTTPKVYSGSASKEALMEYVELNEAVVKEGQVPELRPRLLQFLCSDDRAERLALKKQTSDAVNELRSEMVLYGESYVTVMERLVKPEKGERWLANQKAKLLAARADPSTPEAKRHTARRQLNVLEDFEEAMAQAKLVDESADSIRIAADEAAAYAARSKASKGARRGR